MVCFPMRWTMLVSQGGWWGKHTLFQCFIWIIKLMDYMRNEVDQILIETSK